VSKSQSAANFFHQPLAEMVDPHHPLAVLASRLPWAQIDAALAPHFARQVLAPAKFTWPTSSSDLRGLASRLARSRALRLA